MTINTFPKLDAMQCTEVIKSKYICNAEKVIIKVFP